MCRPRSRKLDSMDTYRPTRVDSRPVSNVLPLSRRQSYIDLRISFFSRCWSAILAVQRMIPRESLRPSDRNQPSRYICAVSIPSSERKLCDVRTWEHIPSPDFPMADDVQPDSWIPSPATRQERITTQKVWRDNPADTSVRRLRLQTCHLS